MDNVLYHYTSSQHLPKILFSGYLKLTESNLKEPLNYEDSLPKPIDKLYKPVVWLTRSDTPINNGSEGGPTNKHEIKISIVKRDHYDSWVLWSNKNRIKTSWAKKMRRGYIFHDWYVSEQIIPLNSDELIRIENTITGETIIDVPAEKRSCQIKVIKPAEWPDDAYNRFLSSDTTLHVGDVFTFTV